MRIALAALLALAACSSTPPLAASGSFVGPSAVTVTSANNDRDLLFVNSSGTAEVRALAICTRPLVGSNPDPADTCPASENFQFVPGPIRLFPASVPTGDRPAAMAGVRLLLADGHTRAGVVLVGGEESALRVVDAKNLIDAETKAAPATAPQVFPLPSPAVDVVAANPLDPATNVDGNSAVGEVWVATRASAQQPAQLLLLNVQYGADDHPLLPIVVGSCALTPVTPRRLAVVPGSKDATTTWPGALGAVWVADGAGDGAVRVAAADITGKSSPTACPTSAKISVGAPLRSLAFSPTWYRGDGTTRLPGEVAMLVRDDGGLVLASTPDGLSYSVFPIPAYDYLDTDPSHHHQPMEPLIIGNGAREATFLHARKAPDPVLCPNAAPTDPCTPVFVGQPSSGVTNIHEFPLLGAVTAIDGGTYFVEVLKSRIVNENYYPPVSATQPSLAQAPLTQPQPPSTDPSPITITLAPADPTPGHSNDGWFNAGVTRAGRYRAVFHQPLPGLERLGGNVTRTAAGTLLFDVTPIKLDAWINSPVSQLQKGDVVSFAAYAAGADPSCASLANETALRVELPIVNLSSTSLELGTLPGNFDPACPSFGAVGEVRAAGPLPWAVLLGSDVRGRTKNGAMFVLMDKRFDYPLDYGSQQGAPPPTADQDISAAFTVTGTEPTLPGTTISFNVTSGEVPTVVRDTTTGLGFASQVLSYSNQRIASPNLVYTAVTGANALVQIAPELLTTQGGILSYR